MERARKANDLRASIYPIRPTYDVATSSLPKSTREMGQTFELGRDRLLTDRASVNMPHFLFSRYTYTIFRGGTRGSGVKFVKYSLRHIYRRKLHVIVWPS
jgi:hypothetical protein